MSLLLIFELIQQAALVKSMFLSILKILKISFWTQWRKNCISLDLWALFSWKPCKAFRIAQCKQPRLVKPCLNSDLYFISKTSGTALLETITSYKPLPILSQENKKNPSHSTSRHIRNITALMCIFSSILNCSKANQKNLIMN